MKVKIVIVYLLLQFILSISVYAEIVNFINFTSSPIGSEIAIKRGLKNIILGKTPLKHDIQFHSNLSIVRISASHPGYKTKIIEIKPNEKRVHISLENESYFRDVKLLKNEALEKIQNKIDKPVNRYVSNFLLKHPEFEINEKIYFMINNGNSKIVFNFKLKKGFSSTDYSNPEETCIRYWDDLTTNFTRYLFKELKGYPQIDSIYINVNSSDGFANKTVDENKRIIMKWVGGYSRQYNAATGTMTQVYNPFHHQVPIMVSEEQTSQAEPIKSKSRIIFKISLKRIPTNKSNIRFEVIKTEFLGKAGNILFKN